MYLSDFPQRVKDAARLGPNNLIEQLVKKKMQAYIQNVRIFVTLLHYTL